MTSIPRISIASSTAPNWLAEAQSAIAASTSSGGMIGALQNSKYSLSSSSNFLANSANVANALASIAQSGVQAKGSFVAQAAAANQQKAAQAQLDKLLTANTTKNYTPPAGLAANVYFADGSSLDTVGNVLTRNDGTQIDITTGREVINEQSVIRLANGAYIDAQNNILHQADGSKIDMNTGLKITA